MTKSELIAQFLLSAANAQTEQDIAEAVKTLPADGISKIADITADLCRAKGLDPQNPAILAVYTQTAAYKAAQEAEQRRGRLGEAVSTIETITTAYRENEQKGAVPTPEQVDAETERLTKAIARLGSADEQRRVYTPENYLAECLTYDPSRDFTPALFGGLAFPNGTTSYIGARTSRGKTTSMVNLAREALTGEGTQQRKVIFITLEMSGKQILNKLLLSSAFASTADTGKKSLSSLPEPGRQIYSAWKEAPIEAPDKETASLFRNSLKTAYKTLDEAHREGRFILYDGRGASEAEIINYMKAQGEQGSVILLDYIQKMPPKDLVDSDSFRRVQAISYDVVNAAASTSAVIIAGAQFNRLGGTDNLGDVFTDESFRECGDLEQDAHNALGIGWKTDKQGRFYEVLKTREDSQQGSVFEIDFEGAYSYMAHGEQVYRQSGGVKTAKASKTSRTKGARSSYA
jgi:hypothetical protein